VCVCVCVCVCLSHTLTKLPISEIEFPGSLPTQTHHTTSITEPKSAPRIQLADSISVFYYLRISNAACDHLARLPLDLRTDAKERLGTSS